MDKQNFTTYTVSDHTEAMKEFHDLLKHSKDERKSILMVPDIKGYRLYEIHEEAMHYALHYERMIRDREQKEKEE